MPRIVIRGRATEIARLVGDREVEVSIPVDGEQEAQRIFISLLRLGGEVTIRVVPDQPQAARPQQELVAGPKRQETQPQRTQTQVAPSVEEHRTAPVAQPQPVVVQEAKKEEPKREEPRKAEAAQPAPPTPQVAQPAQQPVHVSVRPAAEVLDAAGARQQAATTGRPAPEEEEIDYREALALKQAALTRKAIQVV